LAIETSAGVSYGKNGNPPQSPTTKNRVIPSLLSFTDKSYRPEKIKSMDLSNKSIYQNSSKIRLRIDEE